MTFTPISGQRRLLEKSIKDGGVAGVPTSYYRKALDLNRFSNSVANKLLESYRRQIIKGVRELERIDKMPSSKKPEFKAARTRALIQQNLESMRSWSKQSVTELVKQLDGLADVEVSFAQNELMRAVPAEFKSSVRTVEVTEAFAESVVKADPLDVGTNLLRQNIEEAVKGPGSVLKLTARQGAIIRMPDGSSVVKSFRGLAERQGELFSRAVLDGLLTGEGTEAISRSLFGELGFSTEALTSRQVALAQTGNAWKMAKHQVRTLVRTSVNATSNAASQAVYKANPEVTKQYRWIATLDSRTTAICRNLDQNVYEYGKGPTPASPPHFNCRSTTIPVIDYEGLGIPPPPNTQGYRPTKESKPNSADPDGGRVPVNVSAAQHIYDLRGNTKSGGKARFEPSAAQARMLNGGKDTPGARQKARYYNRLADKYGPDGAMKRFMQQDGSEVSLKQLKQRYGDPDKIERTAAKPKPKAKPKAKPKPPAPKAKALPKPVKPKQTDRDYVAAHQWDNGKNKLSHQDIADSLEAGAQLPGLAGQNMRQMMEFQRKKEIQTVWSNGREKAFNAKNDDFAHWKNPDVIKALRNGESGKNKQLMLKAADDLEQGIMSSTMDTLGKVKGAGHAPYSSNLIAMKQEAQFKAINKSTIRHVKAVVEASVEDSALKRPSFTTGAKLYKRSGKTQMKTELGWLTTYVHEMGHQVHFKAGMPNIDTYVRQAMKGKKLSKLEESLEMNQLRWKPSKYGTTNEMERFAETYVQYVFAPDDLKKASPVAYKWVEETMKEALK